MKKTIFILVRNKSCRSISNIKARPKIITHSIFITQIMKRTHALIYIHTTCHSNCISTDQKLIPSKPKLTQNNVIPARQKHMPVSTADDWTKTCQFLLQMDFSFFLVERLHLYGPFCLQSKLQYLCAETPSSVLIVLSGLFWMLSPSIPWEEILQDEASANQESLVQVGCTC